MKKVKQRLETNGVKVHLKEKVIVNVKASTPDEACANALDKICAEIRENKKTKIIENLVKDLQHEISVIKVRKYSPNG